MFVDELEDLKSGSRDEFAWFAVGQFFVSGAFWLGVERMVTESVFWTDRLFQTCVILLLAGAIVSYANFRSLQRRRSKIDRIISTASRRPATTMTIPGDFGQTLISE